MAQEQPGRAAERVAMLAVRTEQQEEDRQPVRLRDAQALVGAGPLLTEDGQDRLRAVQGDSPGRTGVKPAVGLARSPAAGR